MMTAAQIAAYLNETMEPMEPQESIRAYLAAREGKILTARDLPALRKIDPTIRIVKHYGWTALEWGKHPQWFSMIIARTEKAPVIDMAAFDRENVAYFGAANARNASRRAALSDPNALASLAHAINRVNDGIDEIKALTAYGEVLAEVSCAPFVPRLDRR